MAPACVLLMVMCLAASSSCERTGYPVKSSTAVVIDSWSGDPIEGAVAIAIWRKWKEKKAFWEDASMEACRIEEAVSDKEGKITIDSFWDWKMFKANRPHLTVYKPGYVCWDQDLIFPSREERTDFSKKSRIVRLEKWKEGYSYDDHSAFMQRCTKGEDIVMLAKSSFEKSRFSGRTKTSSCDE